MYVHLLGYGHTSNYEDNLSCITDKNAAYSMKLRNVDKHRIEKHSPTHLYTVNIITSSFALALVLVVVAGNERDPVWTWQYRETVGYPFLLVEPPPRPPPEDQSQPAFAWPGNERHSLLCKEHKKYEFVKSLFSGVSE